MILWYCLGSGCHREVLAGSGWRTGGWRPESGVQGESTFVRRTLLMGIITPSFCTAFLFSLKNQLGILLSDDAEEV